MSLMMLSCVDTILRMIVRRNAEAARLTVKHNSPPCDVKFPLKDLVAESFSKTCVHFRCPLNQHLCTNIHTVMLPVGESKHGSALAKVEHVIDTSVIVGCLEMALYRGAWDEMFSFVCTDKCRGLRIILKSDTIADNKTTIA